jgi:hypothetical protein
MRKADPKSPPTSPDSQFIVLLASPRSGTHLLKGILTTDSAITETSESFRPTNFDAPHSATNFWKFLRSNRSVSELAPLTVRQREAQWYDYLTFLSSKIPNKLKILDFKYNNLRSADVGFLWPEEVPTMLRLAMNDRMPIIRLKRRNHLEVFCSGQLGLKTDEWVRPKNRQSNTEKTSNATRVFINPGNLLNILGAMQKREELVDSWVAGYGRRIELIYEDLLEDGLLSGGVIESIERFLGRKTDISPKPRTLKISPPLNELIENFKEVEIRLAGTQYAAFLHQKSEPYNAPRVATKTESILKSNNVSMTEQHFEMRILSARPLVTMSGISANLQGFTALSEGAPEVFDTDQALHLLHLMWTLEQGEVQMLVQGIAQAQKIFPGHIFLPLTSSENETFLLSQHGIPSLLANGLIFLDENVWRPDADEIAGLPMFDAIYNARLDPFKRHELAKEIDSLLLVYAHALSKPRSEAYERVRNILPTAFFANHRLSDGADLDPGMLCRLFGHARVGLCLSAVEGCMRASMEYLLAGLPVVSTPSIGGRDRYYAAPYCRVVEATSDAVAAAVIDLAGKNLDRHRIRQHVAQMVGFDRYNFLLNINKIAKLHLGQDRLIHSFSPLVGAIGNYRPSSQVVKTIRTEFANLHKS